MIKFLIIFLLPLFSEIFVCTNDLIQQKEDEIIIDSNYNLKEAILGIQIPKSIITKLILIDVEYFSFDQKLHQGQVVANRSVEKDITEIFKFIKDSKFPIAKVIPIVRYKWNDNASMSDNNTAAFNFRNVKGYKILSAHSLGLAIDINPLQNPHIKGKFIQPNEAKYDIKIPGTIKRDSKIVFEFRKRGWQWGGAWKSSKDYQHFEKK